MKALALLSGGLDSMLAIKVVQEAGVEVEALHVLIPFLQTPATGKDSGAAVLAAQQLGVPLHIHHCGEDYLRMLEQPKYEYGKNMNPCVDCRIYKFKAATQKMKEIGASFLITGEVYDQRPHSQRRDALDITVRDAALRGLVLRPLCAKWLKPTIPEEKGWIDRGKLLDIKGRGRTRQIELAARYGLVDYPAPTGGCLLTCEEYSQKLKDVIKYDPPLTMRKVDLLRLGRHLRLTPEVKIIIGKDQGENEKLVEAASPEETLIEVIDRGGPVTLYLGPYQEELVRLAVEITAGYTKTEPGDLVRLAVTTGEKREEMKAPALPREESRKYFVNRVG